MASNTSGYNFLAPPNKGLLCVICAQVAEDPSQHEQCGRLLCKECLDKLGRDKSCPKCRGNSRYFKDQKSRKEIQALRVRCSNVDKECTWVGTVGTLKEHVATCGFAQIPCPEQCRNSHGEVLQCTRYYMPTHLEEDCPNREYMCPHCEGMGTYATITQVHDAKCPRKIICCSNATCRNTMERQQVDEHVRTQCLYTVILCKYKGIGCAAELMRKDMANHNKRNETLHFRMALNTVNALQCDVQNMRLITLKSREAMTFALLEYRKKKEGDEVFTSPSFYTHPGGYHMEVKVYANGNGSGSGTHVTVSNYILEGGNDAALKWPFSGKCTITLLNQLEDGNHFTEEISISDSVVDTNLGIHEFIRHSALADPVKNTQYLKDDTLYFRVLVEVADHKPWLQCTAK